MWRTPRPPSVRGMARAASWVDHHAPRLGRLLFAGAALLLPWAALLAAVLPSTTEARRWATAWVGLDVMQVIGLAVTGWLLARRRPAVSLAAGTTAGLQRVDAGVDVATSAAGRDYALALALAALVELPLAVVLLVIGHRAQTPTTGAPADSAGCVAGPRRGSAAPWTSPRSSSPSTTSSAAPSPCSTRSTPPTRPR